MATTPVPIVEWEDVQGIVLRGYGKHPYSTNLFLQIDDPVQARAWLATVCDRITTADRAKERDDACYLNLAFTKSGLEKLGLPAKQLDTFPTSFLEGMSADTRSRILGDEEDSAPKHWAWGGPGNEVDAILLIFVRERSTLEEAIKAEQDGFKGVTLKYKPIETQLWEDEREHFGFHDGISQPIIEGSPPRRRQRTVPPPNPPYGPSNVIKAGEFLLGYINEYGVLPDPLDLPVQADPHRRLATATLPKDVTAPDLGRNGTYLVVRQVAQDVPKLWTYLDEATKDPSGQSRPDECKKLGAKLVGRWPNGTSVALSPDSEDPKLSEVNEFLYQSIDPDGFGCPFGSHTRRANPRDTQGSDPATALKNTKRHRLIRRGRSYGPRVTNPLDTNDKQERGLMFMCINANIERQFEFVQQTWINSQSFSGLYNERDPIFGNSGAAPLGSMTIPQHPVRKRLQGLGGFVTTRGGAYFFLPGIKALHYLAALPGA